MSRDPITAALEARLDKVEARAEISEVIVRYCRALDLKDDAMLRSCFHPESTHVHGGFTGSSMDFCAIAKVFVSKIEKTQHLLGNISVTVDGDSGTAESYFCAYHRVPISGEMVYPEANPGDDVFIAGRYNDRFERRDGVWLIADRKTSLEWWRFEAGSDRGRTKDGAIGWLSRKGVQN